MFMNPLDPCSANFVGIKSFSITRLKLELLNNGWVGVACWNQKFLDYEIETRNPSRLEPISASWNQKFLDYEIETIDLYLPWEHLWG